MRSSRLNSSDIPAAAIAAYARERNLTPREIAFILKGETRLVRADLREGLPSWAGLLREEPILALFPLVSRLLAGDPAHFIAEGEKLLSFLAQDIESVVPLSTGQLRKMKKELGDTVFNLLVETLPERYETRILTTDLAGVAPGDIATATGTVVKWKPAWRATAPWTMEMAIGNAKIPVSFFGKIGKGYAAQFPEGSEVIVSGEVSRRTVIPSFTNPDIFRYDEVWKELLSGVMPIYRRIPGVSRLFHLRAVREASLRLMKFDGDWLPPVARGRYDWPDLIISILNVHFPAADLPADETAALGTPYHRRLAFDKMFFFQYGAHLLRRETAPRKPRTVRPFSKRAEEVEKALPFSLTNAQRRVLAEIRRDLAAPEPMMRLLQGDVGSGKTIVMLLAALDVIASGYRAVIMAPTEILARQHHDTITRCVPGVVAALAVGGRSGKKKKEMLDSFRDAKLIVGTHALYENLGALPDLGLIVIDEQHRFGVSQRMELMGKATAPDVLVVSATPIPRSLALTIYGGVSISVLNELPPGRIPVRTRFVPFANRRKVIEHVVSIIQGEGRKGYWICPLVEGSDKSDLAPVTAVYEEFRALIGDRARLLHGRMKGEEKESALAALRDGSANILVSTVVVEVGVDVPDATFIAVENAERFGLAQLHQLRGRVGRGAERSFAAFIAGEQVTEKAAERLAFMEHTHDGFKIAEFDLRLRGPGALSGLEQSGFRNDPYYLLAARYGIEVQKATQAARHLLASGDIAPEEQAFVARVFKTFFQERFEKIRIG